MPDEAAESVVPTDEPGRLLSWLLRRGSLPLAVGVLIDSIAKYGVGLYPSWNYMKAMAENWRDPLLAPILRGPASFRLASPTSAVLAGWLDLLSGPLFLSFHFALVCAAIAAPLFMTRVRRSPELRLLVAVLVVGGSVPAILLGWVGSYDPLTIGAGSVAALAQAPVVAFVAWALFAFNHAPEAGLALVLYALVVFADERRAAFPRVARAAGGWIVGYLSIRLLVEHWGGAVSRSDLADFYGASRYFDNAQHFFPLIVFSALGLGWLFLLQREVFAIPSARVLVAAAGALSLASFTPLVGLDVTRVLVAVLWPSVLVVAALAVERLSVGVVHDIIRRAGLLALIVPVLVVWDGTLIYAGWQGLVNFLGYVFSGNPIPVSP